MSGPSSLSLVIPVVSYIGNEHVYTPAKAVSTSTLYSISRQEENIDEPAIEQSIFSPLNDIVNKFLRNHSKKGELLGQMVILGKDLGKVLDARRLSLEDLQLPHTNWTFPRTNHELTIRKTHQVFHDGLRHILADHQTLVLNIIDILKKENDPVKHSKTIEGLQETFNALEEIKPNLYTRALPSLIKPAESELKGLETLDQKEFEDVTSEIASIAPNAFFENLMVMYREATNFKARATSALNHLLEPYPLHPEISETIKEKYEKTITRVSHEFQSNNSLQTFTNWKQIHKYLDLLNAIKNGETKLNIDLFENAKQALKITGTSFFDTFAATIRQIDAIETPETETEEETESHQTETKCLLFQWMTVITIICLADANARSILTTEKGVEALTSRINEEFYPATLMTSTSLVLEDWRKLTEEERATNVKKAAQLKRSPAFLRRHQPDIELPGTPQSAVSFFFETKQIKKGKRHTFTNGYQALDS